MPRVVSVPVVVSAAHWPIAVKPLAPARTAQTATTISAASVWRRPRGLRGSATRARTLTPRRIRPGDQSLEGYEDEEGAWLYPAITE